jgi:hypothetical protein
MKYSVLIRNNATGEERTYAMDDVEWDDSSEYWWRGGNFGCDCNRHTSFLRAGGPGPADDPHWNDADHECGETAYSVPYATLADGTRVDIDGVSR